MGSNRGYKGSLKVARRFGAQHLQKQWVAFNEQLERAKEADDPEAIHQLRVASRRLRTNLRIFQGVYPPKRARRWRQKLSRTAAALGEARDCDVQIIVLQEFLRSLDDTRLRPGARRLLWRWQQRRTELQKGVLQSLKDLQRSGVLAEMESYVRPFLADEPEPDEFDALRPFAAEAVSQRLETFRILAPALYREEAVEQLHMLRIAAKHLRYALEIFSPLYEPWAKEVIQTLRSIQDGLGQIHDCDVWEQELDAFVEAEQQRSRDYYGHAHAMELLLPGIEAFRADRRSWRHEVYEELLSRWVQWEAAGFWQELAGRLAEPRKERVFVEQPDSLT